jgi:hypothetical protein
VDEELKIVESRFRDVLAAKRRKAAAVKLLL